MTYNCHVLLLNGPNLNLLGTREPKEYGYNTLSEIVNNLISQAKTLDAKLSHFQSNAEHILIERIHQAKGDVNYIIINPSAFTHTSIAIRDALLAVDIPFIEVHITNVYARESFRRRSLFSDIAAGIICGFGTNGYSLALQAVIKTYPIKLNRVRNHTHGYS